MSLSLLFDVQKECVKVISESGTTSISRNRLLPFMRKCQDEGCKISFKPSQYVEEVELAESTR